MFRLLSPCGILDWSPSSWLCQPLQLGSQEMETRALSLYIYISHLCVCVCVTALKLLRILAFHIVVSVGVPDILLLIRFPANALRRQ